MLPRIRFIFLSLLAALLAGWYGWRQLERCFLLPWIANQAVVRVEQRTGWRLSFQSLTGSPLTQLRFNGVRLEPLRPLSSEIKLSIPLFLSADQFRVTYTPFDWLRKHLPRFDVDNGRLVFGKTEVALSVSHVNDMLVVTCPEQLLSIETLAGSLSLPEEATAGGLLGIEGQLAMRGFSSPKLSLQLFGHDLWLQWKSKLGANFSLQLSVEGPPASPLIKGTIDVIEGAWHSSGGIRPVGSALRIDESAAFAWINRFSGEIEVRLNGANFQVQTDKLDARMNALLRLHKQLRQPMHLSGTVETAHGTYTARGRLFRLLHGSIHFPNEVNSPAQLHALLNARIKRYQIRVEVSGTLGESRLHLSSRPDLSRQDIIALLAFGRPFSGLTQDEQQTLTAQDEASQVLDFILLGRAELVAARWLGLDEINFNISPPSVGSQSLNAAVGSVEVGKYVIPGRLFGSYKIEPPQAGETLKHTVGAEYQLTDQLSIEGTVKAGLAERPALADPLTTKKRMEPEEGLIRFRWKF